MATFLKLFEPTDCTAALFLGYRHLTSTNQPSAKSADVKRRALYHYHTISEILEGRTIL